jgi:ribosome-associated translation inhibitor RaiA
MHVVIRSRGLWVDNSVRSDVKERLRDAFGKLASRVGSVRVFLVALHIPAGGILGCRIVLSVTRVGRVIVTERNSDFDMLIDRASRGAANAVRRHLKRRRARRRHGRSLATVAVS